MTEKLQFLLNKLDGNAERLKAEATDWFYEMKVGLIRFTKVKYSKLPHEPAWEWPIRVVLEVLHLITNLVEETFDCLPRWFAYGTIIYWIIYKPFFT